MLENGISSGNSQSFGIYRPPTASRVVARQSSASGAMLGGCLSRKAKTRGRLSALYRSGGGGFVLRVDRQHAETHRRRPFGAASLAPPQRQSLDGTERSTLLQPDRTGIDDRGRLASHAQNYKMNIEDYRDYCLSQRTDVEEKLPFTMFKSGENVLVFYVCRHMFASFYCADYSIVSRNTGALLASRKYPEYNKRMNSYPSEKRVFQR